MDVDDVDYESLPSDTTLLTHLGAGAAAGILEHSIMYPFDCVKVSNFCSCVLNIGFFAEAAVSSSCMHIFSQYNPSWQ